MKSTEVKDIKVFNAYSILTLATIIVLTLLGEMLTVKLLLALSIGIAIGYTLFILSHLLFSEPLERSSKHVNHTNHRYSNGLHTTGRL